MVVVLGCKSLFLDLVKWRVDCPIMISNLGIESGILWLSGLIEHLMKIFGVNGYESFLIITTFRNMIMLRSRRSETLLALYPF